MTKLGRNMGSDSTFIAVASIPPRIWEQDAPTWKAWLATLTASFSTKQTYKRYIAEFYWECEKTILQVTEQDLLDYHASLCAHGSTSTANTRIRTIRAYWKFAQAQEVTA